MGMIDVEQALAARIARRAELEHELEQLKARANMTIGECLGRSEENEKVIAWLESACVGVANNTDTETEG